MTDRELRFWNWFYLFFLAGVPDQYMPLMLWKYACGLSLRQIAPLHGTTFENCRQKMIKAHDKIRWSGVIMEMRRDRGGRKIPYWKPSPFYE